MSESNNDKETNVVDNRNFIFFKIFCIFTIISNSLMAFSYFFVGFSKDIVKTTIEQFDEEIIRETMNIFVETNISFFIITCILYCFAVFGIYKMYKFQIIGFHFYTISKLLILIASYYFIPALTNFSTVIQTAFFIFIFSLFRKFMK